jgi:hypothetical protein
MGPLQLLSWGVVVVALLVGQPPVLDDADMTIYRAAFEAVVKPEAERLAPKAPSQRPPVVVYEQTIPLCARSRPGPPSLDCVSSELEAFEAKQRGQTSLPFERVIRETTRAALATAFRQRNQRALSLPDGVLHEAQTVPEPRPEVVRDAQNVPFIRFSLPARFEDGLALVFASYTCGNLCAYGWLILLTETDGEWRVVDKHLAWIS